MFHYFVVIPNLYIVAVIDCNFKEITQSANVTMVMSFTLSHRD